MNQCTAEQLVGWQTRRMAKGLPVGATRSGQGRGRKRGRSAGMGVVAAGQEQSMAEQEPLAPVPVVSPEREAATGVRGRVAAHA